MVGTPCDTPVTPHRPWLGLHQPRGAHLRRVLQRAPQPGPPHLHRQAPAPQPLARHPAPGGCRPRGDMVGGGTHMYTTGTPHPPAPTGLCLSSADGSHLGEQRGQLHLGALAAGSGPSAERAPEGKPPGQSAVSAPPTTPRGGAGGVCAGRALLSPLTPQPAVPPNPAISPTKSEFIRAKYQMLAFVHKLPCRDDDGVTAKDLSKVGWGGVQGHPLGGGDRFHPPTHI